LPDLNQQNPYVRQYLKDWVKKLVETYKFDGIRIDTIPEVPKDFWAEYTQSAGVF
jgi:alpha-amylase